MEVESQTTSIPLQLLQAYQSEPTFLLLLFVFFILLLHYYLCSSFFSPLKQIDFEKKESLLGSVVKKETPDFFNPGFCYLYDINFFSHPDFTVGTGILIKLMSHQFNHLCGSRTIPPVGTCTLPRRISLFFLRIEYNSLKV